MRERLHPLSLLLLVLTPLPAAPLEIEVRVVAGDAPHGALTKTDLTLRENGREQQILDVRYVPPVSQWRVRPEAAEPTRLYVLTEVDQTTLRKRVLPGLACFLEQELPPGVLVSIAGLPFTSSIDDLSARIPALREAASWTGHAWGAAAPEGSDPTQLRLASPHLETFAIYRYRDLIQKLADLPGKKIVVVFRNSPGFHDSAPNLESMVTEAIRGRVSIHASGVETMPMAPSRAPDALVDLAQWTTGTVYMRGRENPLLDPDFGKYHRLFQPQPQVEAEDPCSAGEYASLGLRDALRSAGDYYVIRYESNGSGEDPFRQIDVAAPQRDIQLSGPSGYFKLERSAPAEPRDNLKSLYRLLESNDADDAPVQVVQTYFSRGAGGTSVVSSVSVSPADVGASGQGVDFVALSRAVDLDGERLPYYHAIRFAKVWTAAEWERLESDPHAYLQSYEAIYLTPGRYLWELAWLDRNSGREGVYRRALEVPDLNRPSTPGGLYLALDRPGEAAPKRKELLARGQESATPYRRLVALEPNRTYEQPPDGIYRKGETIAAQYSIFQASKAEFRAARTSRVRVHRQGGSEAALEIRVETQPVPTIGLLRFRARIPTSDLVPGEYRVVATLPAGQPDLTTNFTLAAQ